MIPATAVTFSDGTLYSHYTRYPFFAARADWLIAQAGTAGRWLIAGCAWGFLVDELLARGVDAIGCDVSAWAIETGIAEMPHLALRLAVADCTDADAMAELGAFEVIVTEDLLPMAESEADITAVLAALRPLAGTLIHIVSCDFAGAIHTAPLWWETEAYWESRLAPDVLIDANDSRIA